ncbi:general secretion pathway protein [Flavobacterium sp. AG291]|uniref:general secretion pathway protein n=1 Tax=Flavobacterium sp. AG291 TaxID=2184000 RepID=UPI000E0B38FA|nr:general secretion pathway protein [Flavobacterium sp. AG291]RDI06672.1 hypothetical protein DEU42_11417 [Flavobacterium sp. AG291]
MKLNKKNKILLAGLVVGFYICYAFAISKTLHYYNHFKEQEQLLSQDFNNPQMLQKLVQKDRQLNTVLSQYNFNSNDSFQNQLLKMLTRSSRDNNLRIIDFQEPHTITQNEVVTTSYIFSLEGNYNSMLLLLNDIENNPSWGIIKHTDFVKKKNYKTNSDYLTLEVILQKTESKNAG